MLTVDAAVPPEGADAMAPVAEPPPEPVELPAEHETWRKGPDLPAPVEAVVIGASAGAVQALNVLLPALPQELAIPVLIVVHLPPNRPSLLVELFARKCALAVREAEDKQVIAGRTVWFAPPGYHLLVEQDRSFALSLDAPVHFSRPSIDVLFESAADVYQNKLLALVLSGANQDGALGALAVRKAGGLVGVQDPASAEAPMMPESCIERAHPQLVGSLSELAEFVAVHARRRRA